MTPKGGLGSPLYPQPNKNNFSPSASDLITPLIEKSRPGAVRIHKAQVKISNADYHILTHNIPELLLLLNKTLALGFDGHHFIAGLASHFRDLLVCQNPATLVLLESGEQAKLLYQKQET